MISQAASLGFQPYAWTIMPFDFGTPVADMGSATVTAAEGLERTWRRRTACRPLPPTSAWASPP